MASMQRLEGQITQIEAEIKEMKEKAANENNSALKLEAERQQTALRQEMAALRQEKVLVMQQQQNQGEQR